MSSSNQCINLWYIQYQDLQISMLLIINATAHIRALVQAGLVYEGKGKILSTKIDAKLFLIIKLYEHKNYSYMYACSALWLKKSRLKTWIYYSKCQYGQFHPSYISWTIKLESRQVWSAIHWIYYLQGFFLSLRAILLQ